MYLERQNEDEGSSSFGWSGNQGPTDTLLRTGGTTYIDGDMISYNWHDVPGLQKFGSYEGNGDTDGPFVWCGHKPAWVMVKNTDDTSDWRIYDSTRNATNPVNLILYPNDTYEDTTTSHPFDFLSNGFKVRGDYKDVNTDGDTYIYCAWAEAPMNNLYGAQSNAR